MLIKIECVQDYAFNTLPWRQVYQYLFVLVETLKYNF